MMGLAFSEDQAPRRVWLDDEQSVRAMPEAHFIFSSNKGDKFFPAPSQPNLCVYIIL